MEIHIGAINTNFMMGIILPKVDISKSNGEVFSLFSPYRQSIIPDPYTSTEQVFACSERVSIWGKWYLCKLNIFHEGRHKTWTENMSISWDDDFGK